MAKFILDGPGRAYVSFLIVWVRTCERVVLEISADNATYQSIALAVGMTLLWNNRYQPSLRMRRVPLLLAGVTSLHIYGSISLLVHPLGANISCGLEFWIMSIWLPFGIALFHASNSQFLHLASRQKQFARMSTLKDHKAINEEKAEAIANNRWRRVFAGLERADNINRTLLLIGVGMAVQVRVLDDARPYILG
jgi:hypothetical protein